MSIPRRHEYLIRSLERLQAEIPELTVAIESGNQEKTKEAEALLINGSSGRTQFLMDRLTNMVLAESMSGNSEPLRMVASGEIFR